MSGAGLAFQAAHLPCKRFFTEYAEGPRARILRAEIFPVSAQCPLSRRVLPRAYAKISSEAVIAASELTDEEGTRMKKQAALGKRLHALRRELSVRFAASTVLQLAAQCGAAFAGGFLLAGVRLLGRNVPAALALTASLPFSLPAICAYLGAAAGYLVFWGADGAFEPIAAGFLILAELCIFSGLLPRERRWFMPASACCLYLLIGILSLLSAGLQAGSAAFLAARLLILAVCTAQFTAAVQEHSRAGRCVLALLLLAGCSAVSLPGGLRLSVPLAVCAAFLALPGPDALTAAAACGLTLDVTCGGESSMTALLCFAALLCRVPVFRLRAVRAALYLLCCVCGVLFTGAASFLPVAGVALGLLLALLAPQELRQTLDERQSAALEARLSELRRASDLFSEVSRALDRARPRDLEPQSAAVFDQAADRVCRSCGRWKDCWQTHAQETYLALSHAAGRIFQSGCAARDDLPAEFTERCCYPDGFLAAVNEALETQRTRRQYQTRLAESRSILSDQFRYLSRLLQGVCDPERDAAPSVPAYTPDLGYRARGVRGGSVSGDHGSCFTCGEWYYLLLCDGMGTGEEASRESASAIHFLSELLLSGFEAQDALQMLNGVYILRGDGGFSTVDLLQISLVTGEGFLHKWGAAPSYLRQAHRLVKLGAPTPPPGLGVDGRGRGECLRVSMGRGEMLVLVSDGVAPEETERWIRGYKGRSPRELASGILGCGCETGDDRTAAVLCLRPCTAKKTARAAGNRLLSRLRL